MAEKVYPKDSTVEGETRAMRGLRLFRERGDEIVTYLDGTYGVPSRTEEGELYVVDLDREMCSCPDATYGGHTCLHQVFVEAHLVAKRRGPVRSGRRCSSKVAA